MNTTTTTNIINTRLTEGFKTYLISKEVLFRKIGIYLYLFLKTESRYKNKLTAEFCFLLRKILDYVVICLNIKFYISYTVQTISLKHISIFELF